MTQTTTTGTATAGDPLVSPSARFALAGSSSDACRSDRPSPVGVRPWGLRRARTARPGEPVPAWRYDDRHQMALDAATGLARIVAGPPTAKTTSRTDGEDGPSSEDWNND